MQQKYIKMDERKKNFDAWKYLIQRLSERAHSGIGCYNGNGNENNLGLWNSIICKWKNESTFKKKNHLKYLREQMRAKKKQPKDLSSEFFNLHENKSDELKPSNNVTK